MSGQLSESVVIGTVTVIIGVAGIARAVGVGVGLRRIDNDQRAVVGAVVITITVIVGITGIARAVGVGI